MGQLKMNESKIISHGPSLPTLLTVLFIALKLCGVIDWSWWWVLSPFLIAVGVLFVVFSVALGVLMYKGRKNSAGRMR
jgi:hypothetical protein